MQNPHPAMQEINALEAEAARAAQGGWDDEAKRLWGRILQIDPGHARTLTALGLRAFRNGDMESARAAFQRLVDAGLWVPRGAGFEVHQWAAYQPTRTQVEGEREAWQKRTARSRARAAGRPAYISAVPDAHDEDAE